MYIRDIQLDTAGERATLSAEVGPERHPRPPRRYAISVPARVAHLLTRSPEAFVLACAPAALLHGEARIHVEDNLCPMLRENLVALLRLQKHWWGSPAPVPTVTSRSSAPGPGMRAGAAGCFVSGGVDSMAMIVRNAEDFPAGHPFRFTYGFTVHGMDMGRPDRQENSDDLFRTTIDTLAASCAGFGLDIVPVWTDLRQYEPHWRFYNERHLAPLLGGLAHALGGGASRLAIALDSVVESQAAWGSHPRLNRLLSSSFVQITSELEDLTRTDKIGLIARHPELLRALRVCYQNADALPKGSLNCGRCEKCIRTKLGLVVYGALEQCTGFADRSLSPDSVRWLNLGDNQLLIDLWVELIERLDAAGRGDLADAARLSARQTHTARLRVARAVMDLKKVYWAAAHAIARASKRDGAATLESGHSH